MSSAICPVTAVYTKLAVENREVGSPRRFSSKRRTASGSSSDCPVCRGRRKNL